MSSEIKKFIGDYIESNKQIYFDLSQKIWENPELGLEEYIACEAHTAFMRAQGFEVTTGVAGMPTAYVAVYGSGKPVIGFSAEYDALPGLSQKVMDHKEPVKEGAPGQGCGHNLLGAGALLAAVALKEAMQKFGLPGTIKVFGTPAEELCIGKPVMGNAGVFDGLDVVLDWHPISFTAADALSCPAYFNVRYHYKGRTAHGNSPWYGRSALDAAVLTGHAIEMLREHVIPGPGPLSAHTINYTFSNTGPEFPSVVPDRASLWCIGRFSTADQLRDAIERVDKCAEGAAMATGTTVEKEYITASHNMIPNEVVSKAFYDNLVEIGPVQFTEEEREFIRKMQQEEGQEPYMQSETVKAFSSGQMSVTDAAEYSWVAPYSVLLLGMGPGPGWHNWMVSACAGRSHGEKAMTKAGEILAATAVDFIQDEDLLQRAQAEFKERTKDLKYESLLPPGTPIPLGLNKSVMDKYR